jgi:hypothetical protein
LTRLPSSKDGRQNGSHNQRLRRVEEAGCGNDAKTKGPGGRWATRELQLRAVFLACILAFPVVLLSAGLAGTFAEEAEGITRLAVVLAIVVVLALIVVLVFAAHVFWPQCPALGRDVQRGLVERYSCVLPTQPGSVPPLFTLVEQELLRAGASRVQWIEVLPRSGYLWQANGVRPRRWILAAPPGLAEVADTPAYAAIAAEWVERASRDGEAAYLGQRELSRDELREVKEYIRGVVIGPLRTALHVTLSFGVMTALCVAPGNYPAEGNLYFSALGAVTVLADLLCARRLMGARRYLADARVGRVKIVRYPLIGEETSSRRPVLSEAIEVLPVSGRTWTVDGEPAPWRAGIPSMTIVTTPRKQVR